MLPIDIQPEDDFETVREKTIAIFNDLKEKLNLLNDSVYDFTGQFKYIDTPPVSIESDEVDDDVETHESTYDHTDLHTRLHNMNGSSDHNSPSGTENNLVDFDANGYPVGDSGIAVGDVVEASAVMVDDTLLKGDGGSKGIQDTGITCDDSNNLGSIGTVGCGDITGTGHLKIANELIGTPDEITATSDGVAASVSTVVTEVTTNGDSDLDNVTLANGTSGQIKVIHCVAEGNAADTWKITPATLLGGTQITFNGAGEGCILVYADNEGWIIVGNNGGTIS